MTTATLKCRNKRMLPWPLLCCWVFCTVIHLILVDPKLQDLLVATARGSFALREFLRLERRKALLSARDEFGFSSLTVAAYNGALTTVSAC